MHTSRNSAQSAPSHVRPYSDFVRFLRTGNRSLATDVARRLSARIKDLSLDLLGEPATRGERVWRWGASRALVVNVAGERQGRWYSFAALKGGDALDLIAFARSESLREALAFARAWLGGTR